MTTVWTPQTLLPQRWNPHEADEGKLFVVDSNMALGRAAPDSPLSADLSKNVLGGREPKTYEITESTFPLGLLVELGGMTYFDPVTPQPGRDTQYIATIRCRDANDQIVFFTISTIDFVPSVFAISMPLAPIHAGSSIDQTCDVIGATKPVTFKFFGLNLEARGFTFDRSAGRLFGKYDGGLPGSNLYIVQAWLVDPLHTGIDLGIPDAEYSNTWDWLNP